MITITQEQIKEMAESLDAGFKCYWNKTNGELLLLPDFSKFGDMDLDEEDEQINDFEENFFNYKEFIAMNSNESFEIMSDFTDTLDDSNKLKKLLINALNMKKPFSKFKNIIDNSGPVREQWFKFKNDCMIRWVEQQVEEFMNDEE